MGFLGTQAQIRVGLLYRDEASEIRVYPREVEARRLAHCGISLGLNVQVTRVRNGVSSVFALAI